MRVCLTLEYDGTHFHGWQKQPKNRTVQETLEKALSQLVQHPVHTYCAGRTDAGVHATGQVVHFDSEIERPNQVWIMGSNSLLPKDISIRKSQIVSMDFHARFSALSRTYRYYICNSSARPALLQHRVAWEFRKLDIQAMQEATKILVGQHDFSSFRSSECQSKTPVRDMKYIKIYTEDYFICNTSLIVIELKANAFLHHMVRNIVGTLLLVGKGFKTHFMGASSIRCPRSKRSWIYCFTIRIIFNRSRIPFIFFKLK